MALPNAEIIGSALQCSFFDRRKTRHLSKGVYVGLIHYNNFEVLHFREICFIDAVKMIMFIDSTRSEIDSYLFFLFFLLDVKNTLVHTSTTLPQYKLWLPEPGACSLLHATQQTQRENVWVLKLGLGG